MELKLADLLNIMQTRNRAIHAMQKVFRTEMDAHCCPPALTSDLGKAIDTLKTLNMGLMESKVRVF